MGQISMENLDQEPEDVPMDQVLAEIRNMLLKDTAEKEVTEIHSLSEIKQEAKEDYFLLTPEMRCDKVNTSQLDTIQTHTKNLLSKSQENKPNDQLSPELVSWLNSHLPEMIEKALSKKLNS